MQSWELFSRSFSPVEYDNLAAYAINGIGLFSFVWTPAAEGAFLLSQEAPQLTVR